MVKISQKERRRWVRAKRVMSIEYRIKKSKRKLADSGWHLSTTHDMSIGGLSFYSELELEEGDLIDLSVCLSGVLEIFNGPAKVVRVEKRKTGAVFLVGVKFLEKTT
ncbi:MAG: PilZ domain-containing protein, partial [Candidatus Omnitrophica bacterium]|nr:PilZ domain-containing protein [Candidatus Omnitrophota bacterium]